MLSKLAYLEEAVREAEAAAPVAAAVAPATIPTAVRKAPTAFASNNVKFVNSGHWNAATTVPPPQPQVSADEKITKRNVSNVSMAKSTPIPSASAPVVPNTTPVPLSTVSRDESLNSSIASSAVLRRVQSRDIPQSVILFLLVSTT